MKEIINNSIERHKEALTSLAENKSTIEKIAGIFISSLKAKRKIIFAGNGGSAADAQHLAAELVGRFKKNRNPLSAIALSTNTSIITAIGNDFGFNEIFSRQIEALAKPEDCLVVISTSGKSENLICALKKAEQIGLKTIGFLGRDGGDIAGIVDIPLIISSSHTPHIQEMHILAGHIICEIVEAVMSNS